MGKAWRLFCLTGLGLYAIAVLAVIILIPVAAIVGLAWSIMNPSQPLAWTIWGILLLVLAFFAGRSYDEYRKERTTE